MVKEKGVQLAIGLLVMSFVLLFLGRYCAAQSWAGNMGPILGEGATVTSPYGWRYHPIQGVWKYHKGVDVSDAYGNDYGKPVYAPCDGVISYSNAVQGYGWYITIKAEDDNYPSGLLVSFGHTLPISRLGVGTKVKKGEQIGYEANVGNITGPHVHLEVHTGSGEELNPEWFFTQYAGGSGGSSMSGANMVITKLVFNAAYKFGEPLQELAENISNACVSGLDKLKDAMVYLFWIIVTIDLIYGVSMLIIDSEQGNNLFKWLLSKTLMYLILFYIISNWAGTVANFMRDFYIGAAATATGSSIEAAQNAVANPFDILQKGASIVAPIIQNMTNIVGVIMFGLMFLAMIVMFGLCAIICFQILMAYIEFYMVMLSSFVLFVTSGSKHVRQFAARGFNAMFMVCAKLMFMVFFSMMVQNVMTNLQTDNLIEQQTITVAAGGEKEVFDTLKSLGATDAQIAGIMGNIRQEDGPFNPAEKNSDGYTGLFQLSPGYRWPNFVEWCNEQSPPLNPYSNAIQVIYVITKEGYKLTGVERNLLNEIPSSDPVAAAAYFVENIEVSGEKPGSEGYENRMNYARNYAERIHDGILEGATNGLTTQATIVVMDFLLLCKIIIILLAFMFIADRISSSLIKGFANGGFKFGND